jgi:hypothetical protein
MAQVRTAGRGSTAAEIRLVNGYRVLLIAFATVVVSFIAILICYWITNKDVTAANTPLPFPKSDIIGILGAVTSVVGTLVGSYFGVSSANGARESASAQAKHVNGVAQRMLGQLPTDAAKNVTG